MWHVANERRAPPARIPERHQPLKHSKHSTGDCHFETRYPFDKSSAQKLWLEYKIWNIKYKVEIRRLADWRGAASIIAISGTGAI